MHDKKKGHWNPYQMLPWDLDREETRSEMRLTSVFDQGNFFESTCYVSIFLMLPCWKGAFNAQILSVEVIYGAIYLYMSIFA